MSRVFRDGSDTISVLSDITLQISEGSFTVIRGSSGTGKTTLLRILGMLDNDFKGSFKYDTEEISGTPSARRDEIRSEEIGFVFQEGRFFNHSTLGENIVLPLKLRGFGKTESDEALGRVSQLVFRPTEISRKILSLRPSQASGGQRQRAALARAMVTNPRLILADEPTASLDMASRMQVVEKLLAANKQGATVIVVSHDPIFFDCGDQLELANGRITELYPKTARSSQNALKQIKSSQSISSKMTSIGQSWKPKLDWRLLLREASVNLVRRPLLSALTFISLVAGICQVAIFVSLLGGIDKIVEEAVTDGSRLTRIVIRPRSVDLPKDVRFPLVDEIQKLPNVQEIIPRRSASLSVIDAKGAIRPFQTIGLHQNDFELSQFEFLAGSANTLTQSDFNIIATPAFLTETLPIGENSDENEINWQDALGQHLAITIPRFNRAGQKTGEEFLKLTVGAVILTSEGIREFYVSNSLLLATDAIKRDRTGLVTLPLNGDRSEWAENADITSLTSWAWQDTLHIYTENIDSVLPTLTELVNFGYRPEAEIWDFLWVLDLKESATKIFIPVLFLLGIVVGLVLISTVYISARMRENEIALCRVLGMRSGDLLVIELLTLVILTCLASIIGLGMAQILINFLTAQFEAQAQLLARIPDSTATRVSGALFNPILGFAPQILGATLVLALTAAFLPALNAARTDPAKIFARQ